MTLRQFHGLRDEITNMTRLQSGDAKKDEHDMEVEALFLKVSQQNKRAKNA